MKRPESILFIGAMIFIIVMFCWLTYLLRDDMKDLESAGISRDYQLDCTKDSIIVYDNFRRVGAIPWHSSQAIDSLILIDNQKNKNNGK